MLNILLKSIPVQILKSRAGVGVIPALISAVVLSGGVLTLSSVSLFSVKSAKNIELLATMELLDVNISETASSPSLLLDSKDHSDNSAFKKCVENNDCASLLSLVDITLYNVQGDIISNGDGVFYNSEGKICNGPNKHYCPFKVTSQVEGYCHVGTCNSENIKGFSINYKIDITDNFKNQQLFSKERKTFVSRLELLNARTALNCSSDELLIGINNDNTPICIANDPIIASTTYQTGSSSSGGGDGDGGPGGPDGPDGSSSPGSCPR